MPSVDRPMAAAEPVLEVPGRRLSFAQEQLWFIDQLSPGETTYNILMLWRLRGPLRVDLLRRCLNLLVARHESLRVTVRGHEGTPYQVIAPSGEAPLPVIDLRAAPLDEREQRAADAIGALRAERYDLLTGPLFRFRLLRLGNEEFLFCQGFHHIITDGWSVGVLNAELSAAYRSLCSGAEPALGDIELNYTDFAESQRERLRDDVLAAELAWWQRRLAGLPVLHLPADRPRPVGGKHRGQTLIHEFSDGLRTIVRRLADDHRASMFMVLAAAFGLVLSRYSGLEDIPVGVPMLGRPEPELEAVVGMFINMAVLRSDLSGDPTFSELIGRVSEGCLDLYDHQEAPFNRVVDAVQPVRDPDRNPLFNVSIQLLDERSAGENLRFPGVTTEFVPLASIGSRFDLSLNFTDAGTSLRASVEYSSDMFDEWRIKAMLDHLATVLRIAAADPSLRLSRISVVTGAEAERLFEAGRGDVAWYGKLPPHWRDVAPIAPAHSNWRVYVVDRWANLMPRGVPGELLIGGEPGDLAGMTQSEFIDDPFQPGQVACRTGDQVRWTSDLRIEFLGRVDEPVALRGPATSGAVPDGRAIGDVRTPTEDSVTGIFCEVLALPGIGVEEDFFTVGGNSLQAMRVVSRINKAFGIKLGVRAMYGRATVREVSSAVDGALAENGAAGLPG